MRNTPPDVVTESESMLDPAILPLYVLMALRTVVCISATLSLGRFRLYVTTRLPELWKQHSVCVIHSNKVLVYLMIPIITDHVINTTPLVGRHAEGHLQILSWGHTHTHACMHAYKNTQTQAHSTNTPHSHVRRHVHNMEARASTDSE